MNKYLIQKSPLFISILKHKDDIKVANIENFQQFVQLPLISLHLLFNTASNLLSFTCFTWYVMQLYCNVHDYTMHQYKVKVIHCPQSGQNQAPVGTDDSVTHNRLYWQLGESQSNISPTFPFWQ